MLAHLRFLLETIRPGIRPYVLESNTEAQPFSRNQRLLGYQCAKGQLDKTPFGTQQDVYADGHEWMNHSMAPAAVDHSGFRVDIGKDKPGVLKPYSSSVLNISAMSFGSLSANAILTLNNGAKAGGFAHDTGEGSISRYHREGGGDLIWEIGSGYLGCRNEDGSFSETLFATNAAPDQFNMIDIK